MKKSPKSKDNWNYELTITELEDIIEQIKSGSLPLEDVFEKFEVALKHLEKCEAFLQQGKQRMNLLIETLEQDLEF